MRLSLLKIMFSLSLVISGNAAFAGSSVGGGCVVYGAADAPLVIEEFADFQCPYCVRGSVTMLKALKEYPDKIKLVYRNMPLPSHQQARVAAKAFSAVCLQSPRLAGVFNASLFANQEALAKGGESYLYELAGKIGVDLELMKKDMNGAVVAKGLEEDQASAKAHGLTGTPSFLIGTEKVVGAMPYAEIKRAIDRQLANKP